MSAKFFSQKYADRLVIYYAAKNAVTKAHETYKALSSQDKVRETIELLGDQICCTPKSLVFWETWGRFLWNIDEHAWGTLFSI